MSKTLNELLPYTPDTYLKPDEVKELQTVFKGNDRLIKILRKLFLPSALDPELPIEEMMGDAWMVDKDFSMMQNTEIKTIVLARQDAIKFILGGLIKLKVLANTSDLSPMEKAYKDAKDSTK